MTKRELLEWLEPFTDDCPITLYIPGTGYLRVVPRYRLSEGNGSIVLDPEEVVIAKR